MNTVSLTSRPAGWLEVSKLRAFLSHLAISGSIVGIVVALVFFVWYPSPFFQATGTVSVLRVLIGVDLVLGPMLTAIVFKPRKPYLKLDLAVIATVQLAALIYGVSVLYQERPYYMVFAVDRFHVLARKDAVIENPAETAWIHKPFIGPVTVVANLPADLAARQRLVEETVFEGKPDIERRPEFWGPYETYGHEIGARAAKLGKIRTGAPASVAALTALVKRSGKPESELGFLPVVAKKRNVTAIVDRSSNSIVGILDVDPWPLL